jgi:hypothetical protein
LNRYFPLSGEVNDYFNPMRIFIIKSLLEILKRIPMGDNLIREVSMLFLELV